MTPQSYSIDSHAKSSDLAGKILAGNTPPEIAAAIAAVEAHLNSHFPEQNRHFFSVSFPALICKFFGFNDDSSGAQKLAGGWIDTASSSDDPDLAGKIFNFLSPNGTLMNLITAVDRLSLVKYVFPVERLPEWVRFMLSSERECRILSDICPLFKGRIKEDEIKGNFQVQLNVFEYFMFWFAYYPVCRGKSENLGTVSIRSSRKFSLENWTCSIPVLASSSKRNPEKKSECNLYLRLLYAYLRSFVPRDDLNSHQPYRISLLHYSTSYDDSALLRAEFLVNTLVHFWLVDNDFSPLAVNVCKSLGLSFPFRTVLGEGPPASGLGTAVKLFVKYLNFSSLVITEGPNQVEIGGNSVYKKFGSGNFVKTRDVASVLPNLPSGGSWNSYIQRPLYRFILRTFLFCPVESSMKNISEVFSIWTSYIQPWRLSKEEFIELDAMVDGSKKGEGRQSDQSNQQYSAIWEGYVLSNYMFYSSMVMHFIGFAHKFLHADAETIVKMVSKVMDILTSSRELLELIKNVDTVYHSKNAVSGKSMLSSFTKFVPQIREQLQDWEDGLGETDADGSFLHENWNRDLRLFSDGEDGGPQLLQLFILRAETELPTISGENLANNLQCLASLKSRGRVLFGDNVVKQPPLSPGAKPHYQSRDELFKPRKMGNGSTSSIKYKGDWIRRPITDDEVAWLARLLIELSNWLNKTLGLHQVHNSQDANSTFSFVEVPSDVVMVEYGVPESIKAVLSSMASWLLTLRLAIAKIMVRHGLKVNLRVFASKKFVMVVFMFILFNMLRRAFRSIC